MVEAHTITKSS